jgi:hypothetical protein
MPRRDRLSDDDLLLAEEACRQIAAIFRSGRQFKSAEKFESIAERMKRFRARTP